MILDHLRKNGVESIGRFYSLYRGYVIDNIDPNNTNKLLIKVPNINSGNLWAWPKGQYGGNGIGNKSLLPQVGDVVWIEFEAGNPAKPIWSHHGWSKVQVPKRLKPINNIGTITPNGNSFILEDDKGILTIETRDTSGNVVNSIILDPNNISLELKGNFKIKAQDAVEISSPKNISVDSNSKIIFNQGNKGGIPISSNVASRINLLENKVNTLVDLFATAANTATQDRAAFNVLSNGFNSKLTNTSVSDIENTDILQ